MLVFFAMLAQAVLALAVFLAIIYAFVKAALAPVHEKLDRLLRGQNDLARRITALERDGARNI
jgi:hypothetical protein